MPMPARTFGEPIADQLGLVARGVVHDNVDIEISRHILFNLVEELAELARAMARHAFCDDLADLDVERCEERRGPVALVVMRAPLDLAGAHRQQGLRAVKRLDLALLVHTEYQRTIRRIEVEPCDVTHLLDKHRVGGELEGLDPVRLQTEGSPDAMHARDRNT